METIYAAIQRAEKRKSLSPEALARLLLRREYERLRQAKIRAGRKR